MKIVACNSNRPLAEAVAATLKLPLTRASIRRFADMEVFVEIHENVLHLKALKIEPLLMNEMPLGPSHDFR